ncbi:MAG TPA: 4-hydroxybenzoate 3-monooxygenase [Bryobacteraceae bacterium]|nr:4-hydroxybenzoate 3-monooxygenase [Bryobacteraceae bacterium]
MSDIRTQVGIVGAGPAGLLLAHLLHLEGIESVVIENRSQRHVIERVRAGVLEQGTVDLLHEAGVGCRLAKEGMRHEGIYLAFGGVRHRIDFASLTGRAIAVYGQNEVVTDLIHARQATGQPLFFEAADVAIHDFDSASPRITFKHAGGAHAVRCDFIAGCDGFHGICRPAIPAHALSIFECEYPFGWLGILAHAAPSCDELVYSRHERGFALFSMRSSKVTRLYLQCAPDEDIRNWPDERIWSELDARLSTSDGWKPNQGEIFQKGVTGMRSFVAEPMRHGRLFLAGDAAHIVPPTGAKGLNLAVADVRYLSIALAGFYRERSERALQEYSAKCLRRVWKAQRFSNWMTSLLHLSPAAAPFENRRQLAELDYVTSSTAAMTSLAENYTGLPME